ncbi:MAG: bifunctional tetrahydrofolate synthase/dihydrofolate synthase [Pseudomonadales bacterium]
MNLDQWLAEIQATHPKDWDLGLERVGEVGRRLDLLHPAPTCLLVAGTNGKGSTCEYLAQLCTASGKSYGKATSPFLHRFNEQIVINGEPASDEDIVLAFTTIKAAAAEISLSYFEYGALAAMYLFQRAGVAVGIFEIGLGGRLDAMNIIDADVAIITRIALDHQDWLGDTREAIGYEKAGIMRANKPVVVLDEDAPQSLLQHASDVGAELLLVNRDFHYEDHELQLANQTHQLAATQLPLASAVAALVAWHAAGFALEQAQVNHMISSAKLPGRFQVISESPLTVLDVCHNPDAASYLVEKLKHRGKQGWHIVAGIYGDKDLGEIFQQLDPLAVGWYFANLDAPRGAAASELQAVLSDACGSSSQTYDKVSSALQAARQAVGPHEGILVVGSFATVAATLKTQPEPE